MKRRGPEREAGLDSEAYFDAHYFSLGQLVAVAHQVREIYKCRPDNVLEVGVGNGFTSLLLKRAGYDVTTVDINPALKPDICCPLKEMNGLLSERTFDLVVCCEVLEHMPFDEFDSNITYLRKAGSRLFMTLPNYRRAFGFGGFIRLPARPYRELSVHTFWPVNKQMPDGHYWEVNAHRSCTRRRIIERLKRCYTEVDCGRFSLSPQFYYFIAR